MSSSSQHETKAVVFREGDPAKRMYLIKSGKVVCLKASKDRLIPVFLAGEGDVLGESAMIDGGIYTYSAITQSRVELIEIPQENFKEILQNTPAWLVELTSTMINRFDATASLIADNRVIHPSILSDEDFSSNVEVEYKNLLLNRIG